MELLNGIVFGVFVAFLTDYWLGRAGVKDNARLITAVVATAAVFVFENVGELVVF